MSIIEDLWFKRRDIVSDGYDESLEYISKLITLKIHKFKTGKQCWTWTIPKKWTINEGWIKDQEGKILLHSKDHPLHILTYSQSIDKVVNHEELMKHMSSNKDRPNSIPYHERLIYGNDWGFAIQHSKLQNFNSSQYHVYIDSKLEDGFLKVGEIEIKGDIEDTIVIVAHLDHPCMANDDLAGVVGLVELAKKLKDRKNHFTYKLFLVPETIGSIAFLSNNENIIPTIKFGLFFEMLGTKNEIILQHSQQENTKIDKIASYVFKNNLDKYKELPFIAIMANDEQVWNGPGVNIPMISIGRGHYPEYHTSDDRPDIINDSSILECVDIASKILEIYDSDYTPRRKFKGPVFLSKYYLYIDKTQGKPDDAYKIRKLFNNFEGDKTVFEISNILDWDFNKTLTWTNKFLEKNLIEKKLEK